MTILTVTAAFRTPRITKVMANVASAVRTETIFEQNDSDFKESMKQKTFMQNRGFTFKEIESVMRQDML